MVAELVFFLRALALFGAGGCAAQEFPGWDTPYVHDTVDVLTPESGTAALGSASAPASTSMRVPVNQCEPATRCAPRLAALRQRADVSKLLYRMRINGDVVDHDLLASSDGQL